jgi:hypothetical protein
MRLGAEREVSVVLACCLKPLNFWKHTIYLYVRPGSFLPAAAAALPPWPCDGHPRNWQANTEELSPPPPLNADAMMWNHSLVYFYPS